MNRQGRHVSKILESEYAEKFSVLVLVCLAIVLVISFRDGLSASNLRNHPRSQNKPNEYSKFVGRYGRGATDVLYFNIRDGKLTARPAFWHSIQVVDVKNDSFIVVERRDRGGSFIRNTRGEVIAVRIVGLVDSPLRYEKLKPSGKLPLELLFDGKGKEAYTALSRECGYHELLGAGKMFFSRPSGRTSF